MQSQFQVFLLPANFKADGMMSYKHGLAAKYSFKMVAFKLTSVEANFYRTVGTSEAETLVSGKA